ncbi:hypothetical protein EDD99_2655 [Streptomyces sp. 846.5]|nr:hypothetical protein [Streptomyces sp. 846.5]TDU04200.1 hypothetical protein EDD99_2655 [Streptomyces sp. 846.5]
MVAPYLGESGVDVRGIGFGRRNQPFYTSGRFDGTREVLGRERGSGCPITP